MKKIITAILIICTITFLSCSLNTQDNVDANETKEQVGQQEITQESLNKKAQQDIETILEQKQQLIAYNAALICKGFPIGQQSEEFTSTEQEIMKEIATTHGFMFEDAQWLSLQATQDSLFQEEVNNIAASICPDMILTIIEQQ